MNHPENARLMKARRWVRRQLHIPNRATIAAMAESRKIEISDLKAVIRNL